MRRGRGSVPDTGKSLSKGLVMGWGLRKAGGNMSGDEARAVGQGFLTKPGTW